MSVWGVLPVKDFGDAKTRLSTELSPDERRALFPVMVEDVLDALTSAPSLAGVLVLTRDPDATALAKRYGARVLAEPANQGQTSAVTLAVETLQGEGVSTTLAVPGDIPMATADEIETALAAHGDDLALTIVPAWDERGSNCMICSPPTVIPFSFGNDSFVPHKAAARAAGIEPGIVKLTGIGLDVDNPDDLRRILVHDADTRTHRFLAESGIAARLLAKAD